MTPARTPDRGAGLLSRRRFLGLAGAGALTAGGAAWLTRPSGPESSLAVPASASSTTTAGGTLGGGDLILVTIQLGGGLDFLDTVVPLGSSRYHDLRRDGAVDPADTSPIDGDFGLHAMPWLAERFAGGDLAIVHGVGWEGSTLSHFDDTDSWERGSTDARTATGWLGRALQERYEQDLDPLVGVSVGGLSPALRADGWSPVALPEEGSLPWSAEFIEDHPHLVRAYADLTGAGDGTTPLADQVRASQALVRDVADRVEGAAASSMDPDGLDDDVDDVDGLAGRLGQVARLITGGLPTRAFHVEHGGDFDTHARQSELLPAHLGELDQALQDFDRRLGPDRDRVVVATWTEFGRRPEWNGDGTEHGTAGTQLVLGPRVRGGHHGDPVSLTRFDRDDNFVVTTDFRDYLAGLAQGALGAPADRVVEGRRRPLELIT